MIDPHADVLRYAAAACLSDMPSFDLRSRMFGRTALQHMRWLGGEATRRIEHGSIEGVENVWAWVGDTIVNACHVWATQEELEAVCRYLIRVLS